MTAEGWPFAAPPDDGAAAQIKPGNRLPDVALASTLGGNVNLAALDGRSVVFIYPWTGRPGYPDPPGWDDIPGAHGSTPEAIGFRELASHFAAKDFAVFGLSSVTSDWQQEFVQRMALNYALLSDERFRFSDALGLPRFAAGDQWYLKRLTLICRQGEIIRTFYPVHPPDRHAADVLASI
ncbi:MAG: peroxiredoxin [Hyphomonas sp.]|nr:peroxiredoxin [Hyphomonas sp.]